MLHFYNYNAILGMEAVFICSCYA